MYSRHDLVWLTPEGWEAAIAQVPPAGRTQLERWQHADWPAIVRRPGPDTPVGTVAVGVALPPARGAKPRVGLCVKPGHIARHSPPLPLAGVVECAPAQWQDSLRRLLGEAPQPGLRAYGSLALQAITGLPYLSSSSDIDLLIAPRTRQQLERGVQHLDSHSARLPLDGEIMFPNGDAVAWKEWRDAPARVLVKRLDSVRLAEPATLLATLEAA